MDHIGFLPIGFDPIGKHQTFHWIIGLDPIQSNNPMDHIGFLSIGLDPKDTGLHTVARYVAGRAGNVFNVFFEKIKTFLNNSQSSVNREKIQSQIGNNNRPLIGF